MFGIVLSVFNTALAWVFRSLIVKFGIFFALYFVTTEFIGFVVQLVPATSTVTGAMSGLSSGVWYLLDAFSFAQGLSAIVSAYATRFVIRRIPLIG